MQVPLQITFRNMKSSSIVREWIQQEAKKLETFCRRIMGCRVAVEMPHHHHRKGGSYHVRIDLTLPGAELVIKRQPNLKYRAWLEGEPQAHKRLELDGAHKNLRQAIDDAFRAAARRLQAFVRRRGGYVKKHEAAPTARVTRLETEEGYGFLLTQDGREVYFHRDSVLNHSFSRLRVGSTVVFAEEPGEKGPQASTVRIVRKRRTPGLALTTLATAL